MVSEAVSLSVANSGPWSSHKELIKSACDKSPELSTLDFIAFSNKEKSRILDSLVGCA